MSKLQVEKKSLALFITLGETRSNDQTSPRSITLSVHVQRSLHLMQFSQHLQCKFYSRVRLSQYEKRLLFIGPQVFGLALHLKKKSLNILFWTVHSPLLQTEDSDLQYNSFDSLTQQLSCHLITVIGNYCK